jgi:hypothetical protein
MTDRLELAASIRHAPMSQIEKSPEIYPNPVTERTVTDGLAIEVEKVR